MPDLTSLGNIYLILGFLVPGLVIIFVRSQFTTGRTPPHKDALLTYLSLSVIYYALALPFYEIVISAKHEYFKVILWVIFVFGGPAMVGVLLGLNARRGIGRSILGRINLYIIHAMPTAWDWKFSDAPAQWVLVTLKDGTRFGGFFSGDSFASSDQTERDIYIEKVYDLCEDDKWIDRGQKGLLIAAGEIRTIEFWPDNRESNSDEKQG